MHDREGPSWRTCHAAAVIAVVAALFAAGCVGREGPAPSASPAATVRATAPPTASPAAPTARPTARPLVTLGPSALEGPTAGPGLGPTPEPSPTPTPRPARQQLVLPDGEGCGSDEHCASGHCESGVCCAAGRRCCSHNSDCDLSQACDDVCHCCVDRKVHTEQALTKVEVCEIEKGDSQSCYRDVAVEEEDGNLCDRMDSAAARDDCFLAIVRERTSACPKPPVPPGIEGRCAAATRAQDFVFCENIESDEARDRCFITLFDLQREPGVCERIVGAVSRSGCYAQLAAERRDASLCEGVEGDEYRDRCLAGVAEALGSSDPALCARMAGEREREACYGKVVNATAARGDVAGCSGIGVARYRELCLASAAPVAKDRDVCSSLSEPGMRDRCLAGVAPAVKEPSLCQAIASDEPPYLYRTTCVQEVAHSTRDGGLCGGIADPDERAVCAAFASGGPAPCDGSTSPLKVDKCRWLVARRFNITDVCNTIQDNDYRYKCLRDVFWWGQE